MATAANHIMLDAEDEVTREFERIAREVYSGKLSAGNLDAALQAFVAESLFKGVEKGYGTAPGGVDYTTPDKVMLAKLEQNTWWFSHAKTHAELLELNTALIDGEGKLRQFGDFKLEALKIHERYNLTQLQSEYHFAVGSSQMAARWVDIEEAKDTHPYLKYQTAGDNHVRPEHAELDGVIKPVDDPFWDEWYPPNDWGCRCDVTQVAKGKETPDSRIVKPPTDARKEIFRFNSGKAGVVYPPEHPFYKLLDSIKDVDKRHELTGQAWNNYAKHSHSYSTPKQYGSGSVSIHTLADKKDLADNKKVGEHLAKQLGLDVRIRPHSRSAGVKNPEYELNGMIADLKEPKEGTARAIQRAISKASGQGCEATVIWLTHPDLTLEALARGITNAFLSHKHSANVRKVLLVYKDNSIVAIDRAEVVGKTTSFKEKLKRP